MRLAGRKPQHIGVFISEEMEARGWSQSDLANMINKPVNVVSDIINEKRSLTYELAYLFSLAFDISFEFFIKKIAFFEIYDVAKKLEDNGEAEYIKTLGKLNTIAPVRIMQKKNWIKKTDDVNKLKNEIMKFYNIDEMVDDIDELSLSPNFRKSEYGYIDEVSITAWSYRIKNLAANIKCGNFNKSDFSENIKNLVKMSTDTSNISKIQEFLCDSGIKLIYEEHLPHTKIDGATFWDEKGNPVIGLSLRYDRVDYYWFTLLHEIGHIMTSETKTDVVDIDMKFEENHEEKIANDYALKQLIDENKLEDYFKEKKITRKKIESLAQELEIHPAIIVGQLQHKEIIPFSYFRNLLEGYKKVLFEAQDLKSVN